MLRFPISLFCFLLPLFSFAQLQDDFSDGNLDQDPEWLGQTSLFQVNNQELQLQDPDPGSSNFTYLYLPAATSLDATTTWEFFFRMEFAPSNNNNLRIYLATDAADLTNNLNGYYLKAGENLSEDALELYRQDGDPNDATLLLSATPGAVSASPALASVRITRTQDGVWELLADYSGGTDYQSEGSVTDATYDQAAFFGIVCKYTSSNGDNFFFDNFLIDPLYMDEDSPQLLSALAISDTEIEVFFNEPLDPATANEAANFFIDNGIENPQMAELDGSDPAKVLLSLSNSLSSGTTYELTTTGLADTNGNVGGAQSTSFSYTAIASPETFDVLINEIMADPTPTNGLPEVEYVELFNRSAENFQLENWSFGDAAGQDLLSAYILEAGAYLILCDPADEPALSAFGPTLGLNGFPGLNNGGDELLLLDPDQQLIDEVDYSDSWYQDAAKADGGWSLERINPFDLCGDADNWIASIEAIGGTPGQENSVFDDAPDLEGPDLISASPLGAQTVRLLFSEQLDISSAENINNYSIDQGLEVSVAVVDPDEPNAVSLQLNAPMETGLLYTVTVSTGIADCIQNSPAEPLSALFINSVEALPGDVLLNELMIDPSPSVLLPEAEYIELYNVSDEIFDLGGWTLIANGDLNMLPSFLLFPDSLVVLCAKADETALQPYGSVLGLEGFPGLLNGGDEVFLLNRSGERIDFVPYTFEWYRDNDKDDGGWSLERINALAPCIGSENWLASESPLGGTPAMVNSVSADQADETPPALLGVFPQSETQLQLIFSKVLDPLSAENPGRYLIEPDISVLTATASQFTPNTVMLSLGLPLEEGQSYTLRVEPGLEDCIGNATEETISIEFGLPQAPASGDLLISELLFNPATGGRDFLELYNNSDKFINANDLAIGNLFADTDSIVGLSQNVLIAPGTYVVFTEGPLDIQSRYSVPFPDRVIDENLPTFGDRGGNVTIFASPLPDSLITVIDAFDYSEDMHHPLLDDENGVSIERISFLAATDSDANWHSAASSAGYATPTGPNSQATVAVLEKEGPFTLTNSTFSPDEDGFEDFLLIDYVVSEPGYLANIKVFDGQGRMVKTLASNLDLAATGSLKWDGDTVDGTKARIGIYIVWIELFLPDGKVEQYRLPCVVAAQLD